MCIIIFFFLNSVNMDTVHFYTVSCNYLRLQQLDCVKIYFFNLNSICDYKLNITSQ